MENQACEIGPFFIRGFGGCGFYQIGACGRQCYEAKGDGEVSDWIPHNGGPCPVKPSVMCDVKFRDGKIIKNCPARVWMPGEADDDPTDLWIKGDVEENADIIAYRLSSKETEK